MLAKICVSRSLRYWRAIFVFSFLMNMVLSIAPVNAEVNCDKIDFLSCGMGTGEVARACTSQCAFLCAHVVNEVIQQDPGICGECYKAGLLAPIGGQAILAATTAKCGFAAGEAAIQQAKNALCDKGPMGCCISETNSPNIVYGDGKCINEVETCNNGKVMNYSCCVCDIPGIDGNTMTKKLSDQRETYLSCEARCKQENPNAVVNPQVGAASLKNQESSATTQVTQMQQSLAMCFTSEDCALPEYGGSAAAFRLGHGCPKGQGYCVAPEPIITLSNPILGQTTVRGFRGFVAVVFNYALMISGVAAAVVFIFGGFQYMFGSAFGDIKSGKERMINALVGIVILFASYTILQTINPDALNLNRLEVFMFNKQQILGTRFCADIKSDKPIKFAEAGSRPTYTPVSQVKAGMYSLDKDGTRCNVEYYAQGFGDQRCDGRKCDQLGMACVSCKAKGVCKTGANPQSYECIKASFSGQIFFKDEVYASDIALYGVCNKLLKVQDVKTIASQGVAGDGVKKIGKTTLKGDTSGPSGRQSFIVQLVPEEIQEFVDYCKDKGDVGGFLLGLTYHDTTLLIGGNNDVAILGKTDCGSGKFSAYMDGWSKLTSFTGHEADAAIMCGFAVQGRPLANSERYWSLDELRAATGIGSLPSRLLTCEFQLDKTNAPPDPGSVNKATSVTLSVGSETVACGLP